MNDVGYSQNQSPTDEHCPRCASSSIALILYGQVQRDDRFWDGIRSGAIVYGNWIVSENSPSLKCNDCGNRFGVMGSRYAYH